MGNPDYKPTELPTPESITVTPAPGGDSAVLYTMHIASQRGDDEKTLSLDETIDYLMEQFRTKQMFINVDDVMYYPEARFTSTDADNKLVEQDRHRLRSLILSKTTIIKGEAPITPYIAVSGKIKGGGVATDEKDTYTARVLGALVVEETATATALEEINILTPKKAKEIAEYIADYDMVWGETRENRVVILTKLILAKVTAPASA
jgi:hypothetical protein